MEVLGAASGKVPLEMGISHLKCFRTLVLFLGTFKLQRASLRWYLTGLHSWLKHPPCISSAAGDGRGLVGAALQPGDVSAEPRARALQTCHALLVTLPSSCSCSAVIL